MTEAKLNFMNRTGSNDPLNVVIFQSDGKHAIAWLVIQNCGDGMHHPFKYSFSLSVSVGDAWGNYTYPIPASKGDAFEMKASQSGGSTFVKMATPAKSNQTIEVMNNLSRGSISANLLRNQNIVYTKRVIVPGQKAIFNIANDYIYIAVDSDGAIQEGDKLMGNFIEKATMLNIEGIASADIVMKGGTAGEKTEPYSFSFENKIVTS